MRQKRLPVLEYSMECCKLTMQPRVDSNLGRNEVNELLLQLHECFSMPGRVVSIVFIHIGLWTVRNRRTRGIAMM